MSAHASGGLALPTPEEILQAAAVYCQMGWVPLATYVVVGSTDNGRPICSCYQGADCKNAGKHPIGRYADIDTAAKGYNQVYAAVQQGPCNLAIRTGAMSRILVVDLDVKEGQNGYDAFGRWMANNGLSYDDISLTCAARSGGGGFHFVFQHPSGIELQPSNSGKVFGAGVDIKTNGMPFHVWPSVHKYGGRYQWTNWVAPLPAPEPLVQAARKVEAVRSFDAGETYTPSVPELRDYADTLSRSKKELAREVGKNMQEALAGNAIALDGGGHDAYRDIAFFALKKWPTASPDALLDLFVPSIEARLAAVPDANTDVENVLQAFRSAAGKVEEYSRTWAGQVVVNDAGQPLALDSNLLLFLENHPAWQGAFGYNLRRNRPEYLRQPPIDRETRTLDLTRDRADINRWFHTKAKFSGKITEGDLNAAILAASSRYEFDPLQQAVLQLRGTWDGIPRLDTLFQRVAGTPDDEWTRTIGPLWFKSLVARILWPGCKCDTMLILEGPTGFRKSSFFEALLPDPMYFSDTLNRVHLDVESVRMLHSGPVIFEIGELSGLRKQEVEEVKAFLSARSDNLRPLYENYRVTLRRCVFVGTTNRDDYLRDETGGRRFWPLCVLRKIAIDIVYAERAQWFAEALYRVEQGEQWWLSDQQDARYDEDIWYRHVAEWLSKRAEDAPPAKTGSDQMAEMLNSKRAGDFVTVGQVAENALGIELKNAKGAEGARINRILRRLNWISGRDYVGGIQVRGWFRPHKTPGGVLETPDKTLAQK
jgi:predicted P-loop ATPase